MLGVASIGRWDYLCRQQSWNSADSYSVYGPKEILRSWRDEKKSCQKHLRPEENVIMEKLKALSLFSVWSVTWLIYIHFLMGRTYEAQKDSLM